MPSPAGGMKIPPPCAKTPSPSPRSTLPETVKPMRWTTGMPAAALRMVSTGPPPWMHPRSAGTNQIDALSGFLEAAGRRLMAHLYG
jgi:hypothetical protein